MGNFRGINPLLADVWATFLGNSSVVLRVPTYLHKQTRDYVDSGDGLQDSITVTQTHNLTSLRPADPSQNTLTPLSLSSPDCENTRPVWGHRAGMNCIIDHLLYIHTGIIMEPGHSTGDKLVIKSQSDHPSSGEEAKL